MHLQAMEGVCLSWLDRITDLELKGLTGIPRPGTDFVVRPVLATIIIDLYTQG